MSGSASGQGSIAKAGLMGGAVAAVLHATPFISNLNACCCALVVGAGLFAAWILQVDSGRGAGAGRCSAAGALAGFVGGLFGVPFAAVVSRLAFGVGTLEDRVEQTMMQMRAMIEGMGAAPGADAIAEACIRATVGLEFNGWTLVAMGVTALMFSFFGLLGGMLGGVLMRPAGGMGAGMPPPPPRGSEPTQPPPPPPPPSSPGEQLDATDPPRVSDLEGARPRGDEPDEGPLPLDELPLLPPSSESPSPGGSESPSPGGSEPPSPGGSESPSPGGDGDRRAD